MSVAEMRMLRMGGMSIVTGMDRIRNEYVSSYVEVASTMEKIR